MKYELKLQGLDCAHCALEIQEELEKNKELKNVSVNFNTLKLIYETDTVSVEKVKETVKKVEPDVEIILGKEEKEHEEEKLPIIRIIIGLICILIGAFAPAKNIVKEVFIIIAYVVLLYKTAIKAIKLLVKNKTINESLLITISCIGAYIIGEKIEGFMVIFLYEIGEMLEDMAVNKTRKSITNLMNIKPEYANLKTEDGEKQVNPEDVKVNEIIIIKQGEKVPLDGIVIRGNANLNTSSLTGESLLQKVKEGDNVLSGSINEVGLLEIKVTKTYQNSTVNKILELVENATNKKAKTETFVNKAAKIYTPLVIILAILVAIFLPIFTNISYTGNDGSIYRALIFLVISCPCAIAISVPLSYFSGIGKASKKGILIKGSNYLDALKDVKEIIFDKTGTLTKGKFEIQKIKTYNNYGEQEVLKYAVLGESFSTHPIAKSIIESSNINVNTSKVENFKEIAGKGLTYNIENKQIKIGNSKLIPNIEYEEDETLTIILVAIDDVLVGKIYLGDTIKQESKRGIANLNKLNIKTRIFTGDSKKIAEKVAKDLGISEVESEMLPQDKYSKLEQILENYKNKSENARIAFVGDGINDSASLARADIGISMGGVGTGAAIEASDVVIMTDNIEKISESIEISKKTNKIIMENLIFAIGTKILILVLSTIGLAGMWQAIFADVGVTLITIINTLRILK